MDNHPHAAARAAMEQDAADVASRDQQSWDLNVATTEANVSQTQAMAHAIRARGDLQQALANAITATQAIVTAAVIVRTVRGAWRAVR